MMSVERAQDISIIDPSWMVLSGERCGLGPDRPAASYPKEVARTLINRRTHPGDWVLDPFSGWGTTAEVANEVGRFCLGIEIDKALALKSKTFFRAPSTVLIGDSRKSLSDNYQSCQLLLTSSPLFLDESDDEVAIRQAVDLLLSALVAQRHLLAYSATIAVEALVTKSASGAIRAYHLAIHNAIEKHFRYIGEMVFCCGSGNTLPGGFGHIYMLEFANH